MNEISIAVFNFSKTLPVGARILDVGCGTRPYEKFFSHGTYIGIDVYVSGRDKSGKYPDFEFDGITIPLDDASFDAVICTEVLEHAVEPDALLREIARVTKSQGALLITVPFMWGLHELPFDFRRYTTEGISQAITKAGYSIEICKKLTPGIAAIKMLISSELNYYMKHCLSDNVKNSMKFKLFLRLQNLLLRKLFSLWKKMVEFERIYIDNLIIAKKSS